MGDQEIGQQRTEQDVIVNNARDASLAGITSWRVDVPGGRVHTVEISENELYLFAFELINPIMQMRLHRVKRVPDANLEYEVREHTAAIATHFVRCCYQQMRESAKLRFSPQVRDRMGLDLQITRTTLPNVLARIVAGFGPIHVNEGHLKHTFLVPYMRPALGTFGHNQNDPIHPWITSVPTLLTAMTAFRVQPEVRATDVAFTGTEGSAFWTVWTASPDDATLHSGFCPLPESFNSEIDKLLSAVIHRPLYRWPDAPIVPVDWCDEEFDVPAAWQNPRAGNIYYGIDVTSNGLAYRGSRHFYFPCELICARLVTRTEQRITMTQTPSSSAPTPIAAIQQQPITGYDTELQYDTEMEPQEPSVGSKRPRLTAPPPGTPTPSIQTLQVLRTRVGYAGFYGTSFEGITDSIASQLFYRASAIM